MSMFPICEYCGKPQIPPGIVLLTIGAAGESPYCAGHEGERVCCPHCGYMVHPRMHPFRACQYFHRMYRPSGELRVDDVLKEVEAILKKARIDEKWEGAE